MAKALIGYLGGPTPHHGDTAQLRETARLRQRVADLESEVMRLKVENDGLLKTLSESVEHATASAVLEAAASV